MHARTSASTAGESVAFEALIGGGSVFMIAPTRLACDLPSNARRPVSISYSTHPNAQMSERASTSPPSSCSGAI
jgi:hypothetical protein